MKCALLGIQCPRRRLALLNWVLAACCILWTIGGMWLVWIDRGNVVDEQRKTNIAVEILKKDYEARYMGKKKVEWPNQKYGE